MKWKPMKAIAEAALPSKPDDDVAVSLIMWLKSMWTRAQLMVQLPSSAEGSVVVILVLRQMRLMLMR